MIEGRAAAASRQKGQARDGKSARGWDGPDRAAVKGGKSEMGVVGRGRRSVVIERGGTGGGLWGA